MPSTYTLNNGIELIGTGEQSGTWGDTTNINLELLDTALDGQVSIALASAGNSGAPNALPISDGSASNGRNRLVIFNDGGDLGATAFVQLTPSNSEKIIYIRNDLSGSQDLTLFQGSYSASNDYVVPAGTTAVVFFDGGGTGAVAANMFNNAHFDALNIVGNISVGGDATVTGTVDADTVEFNNLSGTGPVSVTDVLDEDNMSSDSATSLATQQSIKAYVDAQVGANNELSEVLSNGNTSGANDILVDASQKVTVDTIEETTAGSGVTIDSVLLKDDVVNATDVETGSISANDGTEAATISDSTGVITVASAVLTTADINGGTADSVAIGATTPSTVVATNLTANTDLTINATTTVSGILDEDNMSSDSPTDLATQQSIKAYVDAQVTAQDLDFSGDSGTGAVDLDTQSFTVAGTANEVQTSASGQTITVGLADAVTLGQSLNIAGDGATVTGIKDEDDMSSNSPTKLATQQSIKAYVDSQVTAQDLDFAGDSGTGAVDLDSQSFTVAGTANEIETSASGQTITLGLPSSVTIASLSSASVTITGGTITGITDIAVADGGTGASTASAARTNLDVDQAGTALALAIALG